MANDGLPPRGSRVRIKRVPSRAVYDRDAIYATLDAGLLCHVGYTFKGQPYVTPTSYWREGDEILWHGSSASRMLKHLKGDVDACVTVTHLDGLVLAKSGFNHTVNYRSVMALGRARAVEGDEKLASLERFMDRLYPGRWQEARKPTAQELKATIVLAMPLTEVSAKIRNAAPPVDDIDADIDCWSGVVPIKAEFIAPVSADPNRPTPPSYTLNMASRFTLSVSYPPVETIPSVAAAKV